MGIEKYATAIMKSASVKIVTAILTLLIPLFDDQIASELGGRTQIKKPCFTSPIRRRVDVWNPRFYFDYKYQECPCMLVLAD
jgi:hypothetical protein